MTGEGLSGQVEVLLPAAFDHGFDYRVPEDMSLGKGDIVSVSFGRGASLGVVWGPGQAKIAEDKIKAIRTHHAEFPAISDAMREFIRWTAWYNCAPAGLMLKMMLPVSDIDKEGRLVQEAHIPAMQLAPLSDVQKKAAMALEDKIDAGFSVSLLDGVTGSGKTEVYFDAIAHALNRKSDNQNSENQILVLLPEIALSVQWLERFEKRFGFKPIVWNSEVTPARKRVGWQAIASGQARVVVGARSALFLPYRKLALIVVDEEHDASYKQEDGVIYHARDMAVARARFEKLPVILVSATPSLESVYNVKQGKYAEVPLPSRHGGAEMPDVTLLDMRSVPMERGAFVSGPLREALANALQKNHQAMLFLNRRGYAPLMLCRACGHRFQCPSCSTWMVVHKRPPSPLRGERRGGGASAPTEGAITPSLTLPPQGGGNRGRLECHHCGYRLPVPNACPTCHAADSLHACGPGVERLLEEVNDFLPQARVAVMASDSMSGYGELSETIAAMSERRIDLLIGTQMIAKGHHFGDLAVVGVVDADLGLAGGDLRAAERTYQLLHQLSGRAGREQVAGRVYLQSFLPEHPVMKALLSGDRQAFMAAELQARKNAHMPPFARLAAVIVEGEKEEQVMKVAKDLAAAAIRLQTPDSRLHILGPAPAPLYMLRGRFRHRLLVQAERTVNLPDFMKSWIDAVSIPSAMRVKIDIDPISFL